MSNVSFWLTVVGGLLAAIGILLSVTCWLLVSVPPILRKVIIVWVTTNLIWFVTYIWLFVIVVVHHTGVWWTRIK